MAIDRTGISSLNTGAGEITYSGNEGPKSPDQQLMASADPMLVEEYNKYVFEMEEQGLQPISFKEFVQQIMSGMAQGGIARLGYRGGQLVKPGPGRPGYRGIGEYGGMGGATAGSGLGEGPSSNEDRGDRREQRSVAQTQGISPTSTSDLGIDRSAVGQFSEYGRNLMAQNLASLETTPETPRDGEGASGLTAAQIEAIRKQKELEGILATQAAQAEEKEKADAMVAAIKDEEQKEFLASLTRDYDLEDLQYGDNRGLMYGAYGGRVPAAYGGIMDSATGRKGYLGGSFFKSVTKPFKKAARAVKKVAKSDIGKLALAYALYKGPAWMPGGTKSWFGKEGYFPTSGTGVAGFKERFMPFLMSESQKTKALDFKEVLASKEKKTRIAKLTSAYQNIGYKGDELAEKVKEHLAKEIFEGAGGSTTGTGSNLGKTLLGASAAVLPALAIAKPDLGAVKGPTMLDVAGESEAAKNAWLAKANLGLTEEDWQLTSGSGFAPLAYAAQGGRIGYKKGGDHTDRQLALNTMYGIRSEAQEGGLMDLGGMEKDYRNEGGFVPIGGQERADDVPARLSKNEFVFTADAVRAAGGGDIDKGAEVMENVMENLEQGGNISQESQGLEGARNMFATAQRLEGVL
jgi:hypothetical protein